MLRRFFVFFQAISVMLALLMGVVWGWTLRDVMQAGAIVSSRYVNDPDAGGSPEYGANGYWIAAHHGELAIARFEAEGESQPPSFGPFWDTPAGVLLPDGDFSMQGMAVPPLFNRFGFIAGTNVRPLHFVPYSVNHIVAVPIWFLLILLTLGPAFGAGWVWRKLAARRVVAGCCTRCGYDLRATPCRCPECGMVCADASAGTASI